MAALPTLVILAGGASSRMWPLREKSLLRFGPDPLLLTQLKRYAALGFDEVILVGNPDNISDLRAIADECSMTVHIAQQPEPIGMGDAILRAADHIMDATQPIYITQVHDVTDIALHEDMLKMYRSNPSGNYMAGVQMADYFPGGYLIVNDDGHISGIVEKPGPDKRPSQYVNIVAHIHANAGRLFEGIRAQYAAQITSDDHYERAMDVLMQETPFYLVPYTGRWNALKYPWHVLDVMDHFLSQIDGQQIADDVFIADNATVVGNVIIEAGAKLFPGSAVVGPAYIGANTVISNGALVRASMVLDHSNIGYVTEVARSYVGSHVGTHACRILDSVFSDHINFSAGSTTANWRIDKGIVKTAVKGQRLPTGRDKFGTVVGSNTFFSVDVMTMPGIKVGANVVVGPGTHVHDDLADGVRLFVKQEQVLTEAEDE